MQGHRPAELAVKCMPGAGGLGTHYGGVCTRLPGGVESVAGNRILGVAGGFLDVLAGLLGFT